MKEFNTSLLQRYKDRLDLSGFTQLERDGKTIFRFSRQHGKVVAEAMVPAALLEENFDSVCLAIHTYLTIEKGDADGK